MNLFASRQLYYSVPFLIKKSLQNYKGSSLTRDWMMGVWKLLCMKQYTDRRVLEVKKKSQKR